MDNELVSAMKKITNAEAKAALFRHILAKSDCNLTENIGDSGGIILVDSSWVSVDAGQLAVWERLLNETKK